LINTWHILGAGSIGGLFACHLSLAKQTVSLVLRDAQSQLLFQQSPAGLRENDGYYQPTLSSELASQDGSIEKLLIATKAPQTLDAFASIQHRLTTDSIIIILQNGMGIYQQLALLHPPEKLYCALSTEGAYQQQRFQWVHAGRGKTLIGQPQPGAGSEPIQALFKTELSCHWSDAIEQAQLRKLAVNCAINGLSALHNCRNGELITNPSMHSKFQQLCDEISRGYRAMGEPELAESVYKEAASVVESTADNYSSTLQDIQRGNKTEIDYINGYFCELMKSLNFDCQHNQDLWQQVRALEDKLGCR
jgi:2-dehydropantoate 2-reductase